MLFDDESKTKFKERSTMVIQQQQSHHWFGTLVTCSRWDFMWLNEGFARYFQYFATAIVREQIVLNLRFKRHSITTNQLYNR